ncbi:MAG: EAL domain-containing protein [Gloeomargaritaceae cyanobacterium C42_A2020_066]|nr:EAL domain-containing protein [Gloeomargaritaceae cyanobacterium C42_A2020_066]
MTPVPPQLPRAPFCGVWEEVFAASKKGIAFIDQNGIHRFASPYYSQYFAKSLEEIVGQSLDEVWPKEVVSVVNPLIQATLASGQGNWTPLMLRSGAKATDRLMLTCVPVFDAQSVVQGVCLSLGHLAPFLDVVQQHQKLAEQAQVVLETGLALHRTLDVGAVLQTAVDRLVQILHVDRALVYRLEEDKTEGFVALATSQAQFNLTALPCSDSCLVSRRGEAFQRGYISVIHDLPTATLSDCCRAFLEELGVRAVLAVPVLVARRLWGLLVLHQCQSSRIWTAEDVRFTSQLALQLGSALYQAELVNSLRQEQDRYRMVVAAQTELIYRCRPDGTVTFANTAFLEYTGRPAAEVLGNALPHPLPPTTQQAFIEKLLTEGNRQTTPVTCFVPAGRGAIGRWYEWNCQSLVTRSTGTIEYQCVGQDITERKRLEAQLIRDALHDQLTQLPNRTLFLDRLSQVLRETQGKRDIVVAVLLLDLDNFKRINNSLGYTEGDHILQTMARRLQSVLLSADRVARLGGDTFALLLHRPAGLDELTCTINHLQQVVEIPVRTPTYEVQLTASLGVVWSPDFQGIDPETVLRNADIALRQAKAQGGHQAVHFTESMYEALRGRLHLENALRQAIETQAFQLHYQPIVHLETGRLLGFEALLRWQHPERGFISPQEFIPLAEDLGLIIPLSWWVIEAAARQMADWQRAFPSLGCLSVSVNLSAHQFTQSNLVPRILAILNETGLPPLSLKLEITESVMMQEMERVAEVLHQLRRFQVGIYIDDFGTGYSSLNRLHTLPIDALKVDRSFVAGLTHSRAGSSLVETILALSDSLGLSVIAEGVETQEQVAILQDMGCSSAQGFWLGRPQPPEQVQTYLVDLTTEKSNRVEEEVKL